MLQSTLFTKTRREAPKDEEARNAKLLIRAGFIYKEMAGVYSFLPLGLLVLNKVVELIRKEMNALGGQEVFLSALQDRSVWEKTGRFDDRAVDIWFKTALKNKSELGLSFTHEEPLTRIAKDQINSFRDLPRYVYQFQTKFRNEKRAKSGILRTREFLMKDLYSFSKDEKEHAEFYEKAKESYKRIFEKVGIGEFTYLTYASGGSFSKYSHEFQTIASAGEDLIRLCGKCKVAVNDEIFAEQKVCPSCGEKNLKEEKAVEVGNIFTLGTRFSDSFGLNYADEKGVSRPVFMGSYGIGPGRLIGAVAEIRSDASGLVWPDAIAPFALHLLALPGSEQTRLKADKLYGDLTSESVSVLYDDRDARAGEKFADADLIGLPRRVVVSEKALAEGKIEIKNRRTGKVEMIDESQFLKYLKSNASQIS
ncbi:MAG: Proline-tRNA ligase [Parcubacteria group bacterium GW2011_GWA2_47_21]|nr:MAG: Proline-tRNA ligase [Parcubacteria group bacterium GW2011_GWA2_47_21]